MEFLSSKMTIVISCILNFAKLGLKVASGVRYIFLKEAAAVEWYNFCRIAGRGGVAAI